MPVDEYIEVYEDENQEWRWRWVSAREKDKIMADSGGGYAKREDCFEAARHISEAAPVVQLVEKNNAEE